jgi:hypothetical protein
MTNHFIAINKGNDGLRHSDFTVATSTTAAADFELRIADLDVQGNAISRLEIVKALKAFLFAIEQHGFITNIDSKIAG